MMTSLQLAELFVSSIVHLLYGFYIFSSAVAGDISQTLNDYLFKSNVAFGETGQNQTNVEGLPPIVLVHGIFGFGKGRLGGLSYFGGAEKKDERVLVPDLGSLTSIYDRYWIHFLHLLGFCCFDLDLDIPCVHCGDDNIGFQGKGIVLLFERRGS